MSAQDESDDRLRRELIADVRAFFETNVAPAGEAAPSPDRATREIELATAALILEMTRADFEISESEKRAVERGVREVLHVDGDRTDQLIALARQQVVLGSRLHEFADLVDQRFDRAQKRSVIEKLWGVAFSDAELKAHEEYLVRKVADMLHVPFEDFIAAKIDARERFIREG